MGATRGPNTVSDNLIFGYDTGYGVADKNTSTKFYKGRPTTNLINLANDDLNNWSSYENGNDGTFTTEFGTVGVKINNRTSWNGLYKGFNVGSTGTYSFSGWFRYRGGTTNNNGATVYLSSWGGSDTKTALDKTKIGEWQRVTKTVNVTDVTVTFYFISYGGTQSGSSPDKSSWDVTMPQIEKLSDQTPFVNGSRSNTTSLIDLKTTRDINLANISFDSAGQPTFDGSDDIITPFDLNLEAMKTSTLEAVIYMNNLSGSDGSYSIFGGIATGPGNGRHGYHEIRNSGSGWKMTHWTSANGWQYANTALSATTWYHVVWVWDGLELKWYLNGEADGTYTYSTFSPYSHGIKNIGAFSSSARLMNGDIPIAKVYDRNLSADEIKQNFNAYKKRFNI